MEFIKEFFSILLLSLAPINSIKRSSKKHTDTVETTFYDVKTIKQDVALLKQIFLEFMEETRAGFANINASAPGSNTNDFFPADSNEPIERFMRKDHEYDKRVKSLYLLLTGCGTNNQRTFTDSFIRTLFSKTYIANHIWPHGR